MNYLERDGLIQRHIDAILKDTSSYSIVIREALYSYIDKTTLDKDLTTWLETHNNETIVNELEI